MQRGELGSDAGKLTVRHALQEQNEHGSVFVTPKAARSRRTIVLSQRAVAALRAHHNRQTFLRKQLSDEWQNQGLVFPTLKGGPHDPGWHRLSEL